jgi:hypothetical protein
LCAHSAPATDIIVKLLNLSRRQFKELPFVPNLTAISALPTLQKVSAALRPEEQLITTGFEVARCDRCDECDAGGLVA